MCLRRKKKSRRVQKNRNKMENKEAVRIEILAVFLCLACCFLRNVDFCVDFVIFILTYVDIMI